MKTKIPWAYILVGLGVVATAATSPLWINYVRREVVELVGLILTVLALGFAYKQFLDAKSLGESLTQVSQSLQKNLDDIRGSVSSVSKDANQLAEHLADIRQSLPTRYIGEFPDFLPDIVQTIESAKERVVIVCDVPGYSYFSNHENWLKYKQSIEVLLERNVEVKIVCLDDANRRDYVMDQFRGCESVWEKWKGELSGNMEKFFRAELKNLSRVFPDKLARTNSVADAVREVAFSDFIQYLNNVHERILMHNFGNAHVCHPAERLSMFFWVADRKRAILSIPTFGENAREIGFATADTELIDALLYQASDLENRKIPGVAQQPN